MNMAGLTEESADVCSDFSMHVTSQTIKLVLCFIVRILAAHTFPSVHTLDTPNLVLY